MIDRLSMLEEVATGMLRYGSIFGCFELSRISDHQISSIGWTDYFAKAVEPQVHK